MNWRSMLFVPAAAPQRWQKAHMRGADALIIDLEDSTQADAKAGARVQATEALAFLAAQGAVVTVRVPNQEIVVQMGSQSDARTFCAIATLDFSGTGEVTVTKTVTFHRDHEDCDRTYAWGFRYSAGSK